MGHSFRSLASYGLQWPPMVVNGLQWAAMDHDFQNLTPNAMVFDDFKWSLVVVGAVGVGFLSRGIDFPLRLFPQSQ